MNLSTPVSDIMTATVITIDSSASIDQAAALLSKHHVRHLPVVSGEQLVGIVSLTDIQRLSFANPYDDAESEVDDTILTMLELKQIMVSNPVCVEVGQPIKDAATLLSEREFHALPVVDAGKLVGILTTTDLIRYMISHN